jgi:SpoVK/Ycf46/Vps4 family AAA+-type ATPase
MNEAAGFGWDKVDSALDINPVQCYFLYGPPGTGKTHIIKAFAAELKKKYDFNFMQLTGSDIHNSYVGVAEKIVTTAFNVATEKEPCLVFIDEIDNLCVSRDSKAEGHEQRLTVAFLEAYNKFKESGKRVIFIGATNHPGKVDEAMLDRVTLIKIPLPAEEDRIGYFDRMLNGVGDGKSTVKLTLEEGFTIEDMANVTDNHSYRDLDRLKNAMLAKLKSQAIAEYTVLNEDGSVDQQATDDKASEAIINGDIKFTRELYEQTQKENLPSDKTRSRQVLKEFEARVKVVADE